MNRFTISLIFYAIFAFANAHAMDTFRFGSRLIEVGDPVTKLAQLAGDPVYKEPIQNEFGAFEGERWQYDIDGAIVTFIIHHAKVSAIQQAARD